MQESQLSAPNMTVLLVDDESVDRARLAHELQARGLSIHVAGNVDDAREFVDRAPPDVAIVDVDSAGDGLRFAEWLQSREGDTALIVMTPPGSVADSRLGAWAYLEKPGDSSTLDAHLGHVRERKKLLAEIQDLRTRLAVATNHLTAFGRFALVRVAASGEVLCINAAGERALEALVDPALPRPLERVDESLLTRFREAIGLPFGTGMTFYRRDGILSHLTGYVVSVEDRRQPIFAAILIENRAREVDIDPLWIPLLLRAAGGS